MSDPSGIPYAGSHRPSDGYGLHSGGMDEDPVIRPFMLTGGRTEPLQDGIRIETLLHAAPAALSAPLRFESRRIVELAQAPMSVADLSVALRAPLGVVRVIVADLITQGYLSVEDQSGELSTSLIERIRDRVRAL
ncbi:hypothetical protein FHR83_003020 [Actinoplanes campanulatus]|uniref:DUF742 domain-containing protein n=1 Tax=Actinoplanes campanulatus TaxID=113559 RepID=A0A7W5AFF5_9ACTN|nr:DUF742 domain-containing protein [Actinoplanes campanulatus]MBB3095357.1 hypothetical protein [Actinoplanes campanulatus]GGN41698.1 hypothetical protein GCM10010109_72030 [Actinoplanes campanulatus]GID34961.1 hypothetical protein Aca09nite_14670 [Actinoplanes campanulatus]